MPYKIWIGVSKEGLAMIGATVVRYAEQVKALAEKAQVYPSQLPHRCVVFRRGHWRIAKPSDVREGEESRPFLPYNGAMRKLESQRDRDLRRRRVQRRIAAARAEREQSEQSQQSKPTRARAR